MAFLKDQTFFDIATEQNVENIFWMEKYISGTYGVDAVTQTRAIKESDLPNIGNYDFDFIKNTQQDLLGYSLSFINGSQYLFNAGAPSPIGEAGFEIVGFGSSPTDIIHRVRNGLLQDLMLLHGDGTTYIDLQNSQNFYFKSQSNAIINYNVSGVNRGREYMNSSGYKVNEASIHQFRKFGGSNDLCFEIDTNTGVIYLPIIQTYPDNATAVGVIGVGKLYIRTGHGLDITV